MLSAFVARVQIEFPELRGARVLVGLSGGADSTALLHLFVAARAALGCEPVAAHVHHHARGADADADAAFCAALASRLGVAFALLDVAGAPARGESREAFWRRERYRLLEAARCEQGCAVVATAHTMDDQAETVLLKLLRGAGPRGVAGIRRRRGCVIRPLLEVRRAALRSWLVARGETWREDVSNADPVAPRGAVRHELLPALLARWPGAVGNLAAFAANLAEDEALLGEWLARAARLPAPTSPVPLAEVAALPAPLVRRWVLALAARLPLAEPPSRRQLEAVAAMLRGGRPAAVDLGRRWVLRRRGGRVCLAPPAIEPFGPVPTSVPAETALPGGFTARLGGASGVAPHRAWLAPRLAAAGLAWRSVRAGERVGEEGVRIAARLAARGVPAEWRRAWPVLEADGTMVWAPGVAVPPAWAGPETTGLLAELEEPWTDRSRS